MKLVIGLGNPGKKYETTRHNIGFMCVDEIAKFNNTDFKQKFNGYVAEYNYSGERVLLLKPDTFMNKSGECLQKFMAFYKIELKDILVIYDDLDMEFSKIKIKKISSSGGHNGIKNITTHTKSEDYLKVKIGINNQYKKEVKDFVLSKFTKEETNGLPLIINTVDKIVEGFIKGETEVDLMNKYNKKAPEVI